MTDALLRRVGFACAAFLIAQAGTLLAVETAHADETVLLRKPMDFHQCPTVVEDILKSMNASSNNTVTVRDTGAHYSVKLRSVEANLLFNCNAVTRQIEISRQVPGDLSQRNETASAN